MLSITCVADFFSEQVPVTQRLFLPLIPPRSKGFTAVVLCYDRVEMMFKVLKRIATTPSLIKVTLVYLICNFGNF